MCAGSRRSVVMMNSVITDVVSEDPIGVAQGSNSQLPGVDKSIRGLSKRSLSQCGVKVVFPSGLIKKIHVLKTGKVR